MSDLLTASEIAQLFRKHEKTIRQWKCAGKISAEIDIGKTLLFDPEKVRKQLAKASRKSSRKSSKPATNRKGEVMVPTY